MISLIIMHFSNREFKYDGFGSSKQFWLINRFKYGVY